jgi:hypothetical protein
MKLVSLHLIPTSTFSPYESLAVKRWLLYPPDLIEPPFLIISGAVAVQNAYVLMETMDCVDFVNRSS